MNLNLEMIHCLVGLHLLFHENEKPGKYSVAVSYDNEHGVHFQLFRRDEINTSDYRCLVSGAKDLDDLHRRAVLNCKLVERTA